MKNTASTFFQHLENKKIQGHKKVIGFIISGGYLHLQFYVFPTIKEWLAICNEWQTVFEQNLSNLHIQKV